MSTIKVDFNVLNQKGTPALYSDGYANRPAAGYGGRLFISTDTHQIFQDVITGWNLIADTGSGSSNLDQVTANGNSTTHGINILGGDLTLQSSQKLYVIGLANGGVLFPSSGSGLIDQDTTNFVWDNTNKRLGLGTPTPGVRLDIHSSTGVNAQFNGTGVTNATLQMQSAGTSKWTIGNYYNGGNNDFSIYDNANGSYRAYFLNTGYAIFPNSVIIGSSSRSSSFGFEVTGTTKLNSSLTLGTITAGSVLFSGASGLVSQNNSNLFWDNTNNRLGIGTTIPSRLLTIYNGSADPFISLYGGASNEGGILFGNTSGGDAIGQIRYSNSSNFMYFVVNSGERMRITSAGNVGIGTNNPLAIGSGYTALTIDGTSGSAVSLRGNGTGSLQIFGDGTNGYVDNGSSGALIFRTTSSFTERMRITSGGNVCINGAENVSVKIICYSGGTTSSTYAMILYDSSANGLFYVRSDGTILMPKYGNGTMTMSGGAIVVVSDKNLKTEDGYIDNALDKVLKLKPRYFYWKDDSGIEDTSRQLGFYAQEVNEALGEEVANTPKDENGKWGIYDRGIIAMLTKAIQEQQAMITSLNDRINNIN